MVQLADGFVFAAFVRRQRAGLATFQQFLEPFLKRSTGAQHEIPVDNFNGNGPVGKALREFFAESREWL
jgi:hypothetical protein